MSSTAVFAIVSLAAGATVFVWALWRARGADRRIDVLTTQLLDLHRKDGGVETLQREIASLRDQVAKGLADSARLVGDSQKHLGERLDRAADVVGRVQAALGSLDQATQRVFAVGQDIAALQDILRAPKTRGLIGELLLSDLLSQVLPPKHFSLQHAFRSGETVDAVVRLGRLVPVDAKFPLENFRRVVATGDPAERAAARKKFIGDVKRHIDAISSKYLVPDEGTFDFALMYIPAESVYYEVIVKDEAAGDDGSLLAYAFARRVVPVSPNSFYAYLHTISLGLRGLEIEQNAQAVLERLDRLKTEFGRFRGDFDLVGKHLQNARAKFDDAERRLVRFDDKLIAAGRDEASEALASADAPLPELPLP